MDSENRGIEVTGRMSGFLFSYFIFTTILYYAMFFLGKLGSKSYFSIMGITFMIVVIGLIFQRLLK